MAVQLAVTGTCAHFKIKNTTIYKCARLLCATPTSAQLNRHSCRMRCCLSNMQLGGLARMVAHANSEQHGCPS